MRYIIIREERDYAEYPLTKQTEIGGRIFALSKEEVYAGGKKLAPYEWVSVDDMSAMYLTRDYRTYERAEMTFISGEEGDIRIPGCKAKILLEQKAIKVERSEDTLLYLNQQRIGDGVYDLEIGDILFINNCKMVIGETALKIWGKDIESCLLQVKDYNYHYRGYPRYKRSPRLIHRVDDESVKIEAEPNAGKIGGRTLLQTILPPLGMLAVTIAIGIFLKRGAMVLMSASLTGMTALFSLVKFFQDKKELREKNKKKKEIYGAYLLKKQKEIYKKWTKEQEAYAYNYPTIGEIEKMVERSDRRIYERTNMDEDFLTFSLGHYKSPTMFRIEDKVNELALEKGQFQEDILEIKRRYARVDRPQVVDLKKAHLGLVGEKKVIHEQLKYYISQLAFSQSYHDVRFVVIYDSMYDEEFRWMRWLSHCKIPEMNVYGLISTEKSRDQILSGLQQILKERLQRVEESKKETKFAPHYVFIVDDPKLLINHSIMEYLIGDMGQLLGYSLIYTSDRQANLPENIGTVLLLENSSHARLLLEEKALRDTKLDLYRIGESNLEFMARNLGVLVHEHGVASHIPESITFFDMYGVQKAEELQVAQRWAMNHSSKSLAVPLGMRGEDEILELNLHEKAHGPHGLIAGTTGSGKSEIVQSYILSLAVNFHPYEVGFLLIDYKGGGMANLFKELPHLLGTITNLDGSESMRALASIQAELRRRQSVFLQHGVNHINGYNDLFKAGKVGEPIPHLFLISDEFAELKKEQPEFMKELVSTARIGRSLGVHLILATQKPTGVVDDQIWTNSKFKLCLKVQNEADSKEVLHTPDAANITQAGRDYLQVGNNEIYELFQSAWSGAWYIEEKEKEVTQDNRVYRVNALGQGELINKDLRGSRAEQKAKELQLDVVIRHICKVYGKEKHIEVKKPWLPMLGGKIINPQKVKCAGSELDLRVAIGILDIPEEQLQKEYSVDLIRQGNILYIASGGYGKSLFLSNAILNLASKNRVSQLNFYVLDFGNNALIGLKKLPHMAEHIMLDETEKYEKFLKLIQDEIRLRKKLLAAVTAQNFFVYNETAAEKLKGILIAVDNYDAIKEMGYEMEQTFTKIIRDGVGLGIYVIATAGQISAVRTVTMNSFKNKIAGFNFNEIEVKSFVGRSDYQLSDMKGRAMVKVGENVNVMQLYVPVDFRDEVEYGRNIQKKAEEIRNLYPGEEAWHIPILPDEFSYRQIGHYAGDDSRFVLGLDKETVVTRGFGKTNNPFLIFGESGCGKTNALKLILSQMKANDRVFLCDSATHRLYGYKDATNYISNYDELCDFANWLTAENKRRKLALDEQLAMGKEPEEALEALENVYVIIDDIDDLIGLAGKDMAIIAGRMKAAIACGMHFIVTANVNNFRGGDDLSKVLKSSKNGLLLSSQGYLTIFPLKSGSTIEKPDGLLMLNGVGIPIRMPLADS